MRPALGLCRISRANREVREGFPKAVNEERFKDSMRGLVRSNRRSRKELIVTFGAESCGHPASAYEARETPTANDTCIWNDGSGRALLQLEGSTATTSPREEGNR